MDRRTMLRQDQPTGPGRQVSELSLRVLMCLRVRLTRWEHGNLAAPYWRIYCNDRRGGSMITGGRRIELLPGRLWVIPPETPYETELAQPLRHFYLHFTIAPSHIARPGRVYDRPLTDDLHAVLDELANTRRAAPTAATRGGILAESIATAALTAVPAEHFRSPSAEPRIRDAIDAMQADLAAPLSNDDLARRAHMNTNAFVRLFRREAGRPPQEHRMHLRIERACVLLHMTELSIDAIAERLGFCDRYHFSRAFKTHRDMGPAAFRKLNPAGGEIPEAPTRPSDRTR